METRLPGPCLVVLIGPSGSGKTTWAREHFMSTEVVSSDELRSRVGAGEDDQTASGAAFELLERIVDIRLGRKLTTVVDTLGLDDERRASWIERAHAAGMPVYAVLFLTDRSVCEERNQGRDRPIPVGVLRKQFASFARLRDGVDGEGFDTVISDHPVAVVSPQFAPPAAEKDAPASPAGHTFGLSISRFDWGGQPEDLASTLSSIASRAEAAGFRDLWVMDHFRQIPSIGRHWEDIPESFATLSYLAGVTNKIRLGALVASVTHRNPVHLGKVVATLDVLSGGRANCGLGIGWDEAEHAAYGIEFPSTAERYQLLEDTLQMLPILWGKGTSSFVGKRLEAESLICYPRPIQEHIPILIGGTGERKTLALVARYADACNLFGRPGAVSAKVAVLREHCAKAGRDSDEIEVSHLTTVVSAASRDGLRDRVDALRGRNVAAEDYARRHNAGTVDDLLALFADYHAAGARHSIVSMPDAHLDGSIESFADVIQVMARS